MKKVIIVAFVISQLLIGTQSQAIEADVLREKENIAQTYIKNKNYPEAIKEYEALIKLYPRNLSYYSTLGDLYFSIKDKDKALTTYKEALRYIDQKLTYDYIISDKVRDILVKEIGNDSDKLIDAIKPLTLRLRNTSDFYFSMSNLYSQMDNPTEQENYLQKIIKIDPLYYVPYLGLGGLYHKQKEYDKSVEMLTKGLKESKDPHSDVFYFILGMDYKDMELLDKSVDAYEESIKLNPKFIGSYINLAGVYSKQNKDEEAISVLNKALIQEPKDDSVLNSLVHLYAKNKEYDKALNFINTSIDKNDLGLYNRLVGTLNYNKGDIDKAKENYNIGCQNGDEDSCYFLNNPKFFKEKSNN